MQRECPVYRMRSTHADVRHRTTALRELHEETGYGSGKAGEGNAEVGEVSPVLVKDPG